MDVLLISESTLKKYSLVNENVDGKYILTAIQMTQDVDLDTLLGTVLNEKLQAMVADGSISQEANANYKLLLDKYVTPYMVYQVMANVQVALNYKIANSGAYQNGDDKQIKLSYEQNKALKNQYDHYASSYGQKLSNYLLKNTNIYPEYKQSENYQWSEDPKLCDIYLEDVWIPNKRTYKYK